MGKIAALAVALSAATMLAGGNLNLASYFPNRSRETAPGSDCVIKGNISYNSGRRIYHLPGQKDYVDTRISPERGEKWFCSEAEARAAGWRKAGR